MNDKLLLGISLAGMVVATILWYAGDTYFLREATAGNWWAGIKWLGLDLLALPLYAASTYGLFVVKRSWWLIEFPYWIVSIFISLFLFRHLLDVRIGWRELVSAGLLVVIAFLLGSN